MAESGPTGREISVTEAQQRQQAGAMLVDVREQDEWATGHVPGARNVPLSRIPERLDQLRQVPDLLLVCRSGNRSGQAQRFLGVG